MKGFEMTWGDCTFTQQQQKADPGYPEISSVEPGPVRKDK